MLASSTRVASTFKARAIDARAFFGLGMSKNKIKPIDVAQGFGKALDHDDFASVKGLIRPDCVYTVGESTHTGPDAIAASYEQNMTEGRARLDEVVCGQSVVEAVGENEFLIHFTDHIKHKGKSFIHRCKQKITIGDDLRIVRIEFINDDNEAKRLQDFYEQVGVRVD